MTKNNDYRTIKKKYKSSIVGCFFIVFLIATYTLKAQTSDASRTNNSNNATDSLSVNSVCAPVENSSDTKIFNWILKNTGYDVLLKSTVTKYSLLVPLDSTFTNYIDPIAYAKNINAVLKFWFNNNTNSVNATAYSYDKQSKQIGNPIATITNSSFIANRLKRILYSSIISGSIQSGQSFYNTKGNDFIKITGAGENMLLSGGENIVSNTGSKIKAIYNQSNGETYFIDKPIQPSLKSVYKILSETPEFSKFFSLLVGFPSTSTSAFFVSKADYYGIDYNVKFFKTYKYTVYVPTNQAIQKAIDERIITPWSSEGSIVGINDMTDETQKSVAITKLERFIRYHFQDNSVYITNQTTNNRYRTATIKNDDTVSSFGTSKNKFYKIDATVNDENLNLVTENGTTAKVVKSNDLYNIMACEYIFNYNLSTIKEIDGTGSGTYNFTYSQIITSSSAVIHQIDNVLTFE